jgi:hypothetical protein
MPTKFIFVLSPRTHLLDLAGPDQVLFEAIFYKAPFQLEYCRFAEEASAASGLRFGALRHYSEIEVRAGDYVFIPGMDTDVLAHAHHAAKKNLFDWLSSIYAQKLTSAPFVQARLCWPRAVFWTASPAPRTGNTRNNCSAISHA